MVAIIMCIFVSNKRKTDKIRKNKKKSKKTLSNPLDNGEIKWYTNRAAVRSKVERARARARAKNFFKNF